MAVLAVAGEYHCLDIAHRLCYSPCVPWSPPPLPATPVGPPGPDHRGAVRGARRTRREGPVGDAAHRSGLDAAAPLIAAVRGAGGGRPGGPAGRARAQGSASGARHAGGFAGGTLACSARPAGLASAAASAARVPLAPPACAGGRGLWRAGRALAGRPGARFVAGGGAASRPHPAPALPDAWNPAPSGAACGTARAGIGRRPRRFRPLRGLRLAVSGCAPRVSPGGRLLARAAAHGPRPASCPRGG